MLGNYGEKQNTYILYFAPSSPPPYRKH